MLMLHVGINIKNLSQ
nr:hypothetical protein SYMBAF_10106 [Serratia symbiotica]